jgi:hypothetical protein
MSGLIKSFLGFAAKQYQASVSKSLKAYGDSIEILFVSS